MKKLWIAAFAAALPWAVAAQVEKQVEVTKAYVPSVESAAKLAVTPDMTDTVTMRPEIDYTITPLSLRTTLSTRPIRPATVTYWEFNRPRPFYLKVGAGYPLNSVLDFYASSQNPGTGYVVGSINHEGRYAKIKNDFGVKNNSTQMFNRVGVAAGKYFGKRTLEGEVYYDNRMYHRYGDYLSPKSVADFTPGQLVDYSDAQAAFRFGDDFKDLSRVNFEVAVSGGLFFDHSEAVEYNNKARQTNFATHAKIARAFGRHSLSAEVGYERLAGQKAIDGFKEHIIRAGLRYGVDGGVVRLEAGADYYHDKITGNEEAQNYIIPYLHLDFNLGTPGLKPFLEIDGGVYNNSYRSLTQQNPYVMVPNILYQSEFLSETFELANKSSADYNGRFGIGGSLWREKFAYRLYAGFSVRDNHNYWVNDALWVDYDKRHGYCAGTFWPVQARQTVTSFNVEAEYRPLSALRLTLGAHGYLYNDGTNDRYNDRYNLYAYDIKQLGSGSPAFEGNLGIRYEGRKISFGVEARLQTQRSWTVRYVAVSQIGGAKYGNPEFKKPWFTAPTAVDLRVDFEWRVSRSVSIFAEGRNLANARLYQFAWYPEYGASCTLGVKVNF